MAAPGGLSERVLAAFSAPDGPMAVALSGGPDSAVCAWASSAGGRATRALHVHHGSAASDTLAEAAAAIASCLGVELTVLRVEVPPGPSWEDQARRVRYHALEMALTSGEWLATGHTADDQAETVLAALVRGTGVDGLAGISPRRGRLIRPLLSVRRDQTRRLATELGLPWVEDPTNLDPSPRRNRIRGLLADLERVVPGAGEAIARAAGLAAADAATLERLAARARVERRGDEVRVPIGELTAEPAVASRVIRRALRLSRPPHAGTSAEVMAALSVVVGAAPSATLGRGIAVYREGPWLLLAPAHPPPPPAPIAWDLDGTLWWGWFNFSARSDARLARPLSPWQAVLPGPVRIRPPRRGDRISIGAGRKPVSEALAEAGVPARRRPSWPVVERSGEVVWIPGVRWAAGNWAKGDRPGYLWVVAAEEPWASAP